jgi:hypothetical protein
MGAMKCATTTLHRQLGRQPGVFMSRLKEPNFFSDDEIHARGLEWYGSLFGEAEPGALCGESSTHYTKLPTYPRTLERMSQVVPLVKLIYIMRDPIDRWISQYTHEVVTGRIAASADEAVARHPELAAYSRYAYQLEPYLHVFGPAQVLPVFFERLISNPQDELDRLGQFLGVPRRLVWDPTLGPQNTQSDHLRKSVVRDALVNAPVLGSIRRWLIPRPLSEHVKGLWKWKAKRPELTDRSVAYLRDLFNDDLARLGSWLGVAIDCETFRQMACSSQHDWVTWRPSPVALAQHPKPEKSRQKDDFRL